MAEVHTQDLQPPPHHATQINAQVIIFHSFLWNITWHQLSTLRKNHITHTESCQRATTKEECETFARQHGLTDTTATETSSLYWPASCYYKPSNDYKKLWYNTAVNGNTSPCTDIRNCVCKNGIRSHAGGKIPWIVIVMLGYYTGMCI